MNTWAVTGRVKHVTSRAAANRTVYQIAVTIPGREREGLAVFDWWDSPPEIGATVFACGYVCGREYKDRLYAGLTASELHVLGAPAETPADSRQAQRDRDETAATATNQETQDDIPF